MRCITGYLAWGNGEPCPICGIPFAQADIGHILEVHAEALLQRIGLIESRESTSMEGEE